MGNGRFFYSSFHLEENYGITVTKEEEIDETFMNMELMFTMTIKR
jgi:hypothetical protein